MDTLLPSLIRVLIPLTVAFLVGMASTPLLLKYLYYFKAWKKTPGKRALDGTNATEFLKLHAENETRAPRMGGIVIWLSATVSMLACMLLAQVAPHSDLLFSIDFFSRNQTWMAFATLWLGAFVGLIDDLLVIRPGGSGLRLRVRLLLVVAMSVIVGWWFYSKLGVTAINIPFEGPIYLGIFVIPFFILMTLGLYASGVIDGIDGLSGGVFSAIFSAYSIIAFSYGQTDLAAFCAAVVGGLLAFLWYNIPPARFYMSDTGTMALTLALSTVAFTSDTLADGYGVFVLPIIGGVLVVTVLSNIAQMVSKKYFKRKLLKIAPLHHHFEAIGWKPYTVVMRYWIISVMCAFVGVIVALIAFA